MRPAAALELAAAAQPFVAALPGTRARRERLRRAVAAAIEGPASPHAALAEFREALRRCERLGCDRREIVIIVNRGTEDG